jgi:hypothetical protein
MHKTSIIAALFGAAFILLSPAVQAQEIPAGTSPCCDRGDVPLDTPPGNNPPGVTIDLSSSPTTFQCGNELGYLRRVFADQVEALQDQDRITVVPVCEGDDYAFRNDGNAGALRGAMSENEIVLAALASSAYRPIDVVAIRLTGENSAILYVHPSDY